MTYGSGYLIGIGFATLLSIVLYIIDRHYRKKKMALLRKQIEAKERAINPNPLARPEAD